MAEEHFDAVVVGSGFGGAVSAYRLAEAGLSVCVLERGRAYPPGDFPRGVAAMRENYWDPSRGGYGMFNVWSFSDLEAVVSSGLGGGSLIYANVLLPMDERWFVNEGAPAEPWPISYADLDPHYERVRHLLGAVPYPLDRPAYATTRKATALVEAARSLGHEVSHPPLAVAFANRGDAPAVGVPIETDVPSLHGRQRFTCRLCGECDIGCNTGSKNSLDHTYLSAAAQLGADLRTLCEVRSFTPVRLPGAPGPPSRGPAGAPGQTGYRVRYVRHDDTLAGTPSNTRDLPLHTVTADRLILAAGSLGTTYLLLKHRDNFPGISRAALGTRFCGNGDVLGFLSRSRTADRKHVRLLDPSHGPVITTAVRYPDRRDGGAGPGFYVQDGGFPEFVGWLLEARGMPGAVGRVARFLRRRLVAALTGDPRSDYGAEVMALFGSGGLSSGALPLLGMGRDVPDGVLSLRRDNLHLDWTTRTSRQYFGRVRGAMRAVARELNADFIDDPLWYLRRVVTVHPLGGCPMHADPARGVVDGYGQVHNHPGLYIVDGSVMPGPIGANPALTIAAFADRAADRMVGA
jgi:cholesterol oxidase